jgi:hypothetical protein
LDSVVLTRTDGGTFNLQSIDLIEVRGFNSDGTQADFGPGNVTFVGTRRNGSIVTYTAAFLQFPTVTEVDFAAFTDLLSVSWQQGPGGVPGPTYQFDNIRVRAVAEPSTLLLSAIGVLLLLMRRRLPGAHTRLRSYP